MKLRDIRTATAKMRNRLEAAERECWFSTTNNMNGYIVMKRKIVLRCNVHLLLLAASAINHRRRICSYYFYNGGLLSGTSASAVKSGEYKKGKHYEVGDDPSTLLEAIVRRYHVLLPSVLLFKFLKKIPWRQTPPKAHQSGKAVEWYRAHFP